VSVESQILSGHQQAICLSFPVGARFDPDVAVRVELHDERRAGRSRFAIMVFDWRGR
jgi:hypothetical protein